MEEKTHEQPHTQDHEHARESESHPVKNTRKLSKRIILLLVAFVVLITLVAGGAAFYFLGKNPNTYTANPTVTPTQKTAWKTYTNTKNNFTINYPDDWSVKESDSKNSASFNPTDKPASAETTDAISISVGKTLGNYVNLTFEEYAKMAGKEIQNYNSLATFKKITTVAGAVGYETTWMIQPMTVMGRPPTEGESESLPITYFEIPGNKTSLIRVSLDKNEYLATYEKIITTVKVMAPLTPIPTTDESAVLKNVIKKYIALKHNSNEDSFNVTVSKIEGNYAQGGVSDEGGGGMWFAAKEDGFWMLVWDGNGIIECSIFTLYPNFPTSMIPQCYDTEKQDVVQR